MKQLLDCLFRDRPAHIPKCEWKKLVRSLLSPPGRILTALVLSLSLLTAPVVVTGCGTPSANKTAYRTVTSIVYAVDAAKNVYYDYRKIRGVTPETEAKFKAAYLDYQAAMKVVKTVYGSQQVPDSDPVITLGNELIWLIQEVTQNTKLKRI